VVLLGGASGPLLYSNLNNDCDQIPLYAMFKLWTSIISPYVLGRSSALGSEDGAKEDTVSKRQEKLRKRSERGDARVKAQSIRK
jgi:SRP-independent targeting protein 2/TMEM208